MIRFLLRVLATLTLAAAIILAVVDATRSVAASQVVLTPLAESWAAAFPGGLEALRAFLETRVAGFLWDPFMVALLAQPGFVVLAIAAFLLYMVGRRPRRARDGWA